MSENCRWSAASCSGAKGVNVVDFGVQKDRYADQLRVFADIVRGRAPNANLYDHDLAVHAVTRMACGLD